MANLTVCRTILLGSLLAALSGCQSGGNTELLERQLRIQEDRIYQLEDELERHCKMLQACRKENQTLKTATPTPAATPTTAPASKSPAPVSPPPDLTPPKLELDLPPVPPPSSSSGAEMILPGPKLTAPSIGEPVAGRLPSGSTLQIRVPGGDKSESPPKSPERLVDQSTGSNIAPQTYYEPDNEPSRQRQAARPAARRPQWSPYR
jgi:hypothetical protein